MNSSPTEVERRVKGRRRSLMQGRICYGPQAAISLPCVIRNLGESGAMLEVPADQVLPARFALIHVSEGVAYDVQLTWREAARVGVAFLARHDLQQSTTAELRQLRRIWAALAAS